MELLRSTVDGQIAAQEYQNKLFKNGMTGKAVLNYTGELSDGAKRKLIAQFEEFGVGASNAGRIIPACRASNLNRLTSSCQTPSFWS